MFEKIYQRIERAFNTLSIKRNNKNDKETTVNNIVAIHSGVVSLLFMVVSLFFILLCFQFSLAHINILQQRSYLCLQVFNLHIALMQHVILRDDEEGGN